MLLAAVVLPGLLLAWLLAGPAASWRRRLAGVAAAGGALVVTSGAWIAAVALTPAADRPWVGSTSDDSVVSLALGYNGVGRVAGQAGGTSFGDRGLRPRRGVLGGARPVPPAGRRVRRPGGLAAAAGPGRRPLAAAGRPPGARAPPRGLAVGRGRMVRRGLRPAERRRRDRAHLLRLAHRPAPVRAGRGGPGLARRGRPAGRDLAAPADRGARRDRRRAARHPGPHRLPALARPGPRPVGAGRRPGDRARGVGPAGPGATPGRPGRERPAVGLLALLLAPGAWALSASRGAVSGVFPGAGPRFVSGLSGGPAGGRGGALLGGGGTEAATALAWAERHRPGRPLRADRGQRGGGRAAGRGGPAHRGHGRLHGPGDGDGAVAARRRWCAPGGPGTSCSAAPACHASPTPRWSWCSPSAPRFRPRPGAGRPGRAAGSAGAARPSTTARGGPGALAAG